MDYSFELVRKTTPINIKEICRKFENGHCAAGKQDQGKHSPTDSTIKTSVRPALGPKPNATSSVSFRNGQVSSLNTQNSHIPIRPARTRKNSPKKKPVQGTSQVVGGQMVNRINPNQQNDSAPRRNNEAFYRTRTPSFSVSERKKLYEELEHTTKPIGSQRVQWASPIKGCGTNGCEVTYAIPIKYSETLGRYKRASLKGNNENGDGRLQKACSYQGHHCSVEDDGAEAPRKPPRTFAHDKYLASHQPDECNYISDCKNPVPSKVKKVFGTAGNRKYVPHLLPKPNFAQLMEKNNVPSHKVPCDYATPIKQGKPPKQNPFFDLSDVSMNQRYYGTLRKSFSEEHVYEEPSDAIPTRTSRISKMDFSNHGVGSEGNQESRPQLHYMCVPLIDLPASEVGSSKTLGPCHRKRSPLLQFNSPKSGKSSLNNIRDVVNQSFVQLWRRLYPHSGNGDIGGEHDCAEDVGADSGSEVSMKDVQERIIYVRSLRKQIVGTPNRRDPSSDCNRLFEGIFISCLSSQLKESRFKPRLMVRFPKEQKETVYDHSMIPQLSFPDYLTLKTSSAYKSESFISILMDERGEKTYCYCLRLIGNPSFPTNGYITLPVAVCLLTSHNSPSFYMKVLLEIEKHLLLSEVGMQDYLSELYNLNVPTPGSSVMFPDKIEHGDAAVSILRPLDNRIVDAKLTSLLQHLEIDLLLKIIGSMMLERRVLLLADSCSMLFQTTNAVLALFYPLFWQHSVLPVLPECLLAQACTSSPFLFGVLSQSYHKVVEMQKEKILVVDIDQGLLLNEVGDEDTILPSRIQKALKIALNLAKNMTDPTEMLRDVMISEAFLRMFVETLGNVDSFITQQNVFQREAFCKSSSSRGIQMFLQWFTETQMFEVFIRKRLVSAKLQQFWDVQPGHTVKQSLFERRIQEYWCNQNPVGLRGNVRELGKKVKTFGGKLKHLKAF